MKNIVSDYKDKELISCEQTQSAVSEVPFRQSGNVGRHECDTPLKASEKNGEMKKMEDFSQNVWWNEKMGLTLHSQLKNCA